MATMPLLIPRISATETGNEISWPGTESHYDALVSAWCEAACEEAEYEQEQVEELQQIRVMQNYLAGKQWTNQRASYKSKPVNNRLFRLFWELIGQLTDIRPLIEVKSSDTSEEAKKVANNLSLGVKAWSMESQFDLRLAMCVAYGILSTAFAKLQWNPEANHGTGAIELLPLPADAILLLKPDYIDPIASAECVIYKRAVSLGWLRQKFGARGADVPADPRFSRYESQQTPPSNIAPLTYNMLGPAMKRVLAGSPKMNTSAVPMCLYREFWAKDHTVNTSNVTVRMGRGNWSYLVRPGDKLYPRGRLIVMGGPKIVEDGPNPYWHGRPPFSMLRLNVVPWQLYGMSVLKPLMDLQDIVNGILAGVLDVVKKAVNPAFYAPRNAFSAQVWDSLDFSMPNARVGYNQSAVHEPKFVPQPQLPGFILPLMQNVEREMDQQSTGALATEAARKKQMPGADALEAMQQEKQTPVRLQGRNIESFIGELGYQMVPNLLQFWTLKKRISTLGTGGLTAFDFDWDPGTMIPAGKNPADQIGMYAFQIQQGSLLNIKRMQEQAQLVGLRKMKEIDRRTFFKLANLNINVDEVEANLKKEAAEMGGAAPPPRGRK